MTDEDWATIGRRSLFDEEAEGWDSLHTMATNYPAGDSPWAILCPFPRCGFERYDPRDMFKHVHFGPHGNSYGMTLDEYARWERAT